MLKPIKFKRQNSLLKNLKLNTAGNTNDYFERRETEYPFYGMKTERSIDQMSRFLMPL